MLKIKPGTIEITDKKNFTDYLLVEVDEDHFQIEKMQFGADWDEKELKHTVIKTLETKSEKQAIFMFFMTVEKKIITARNLS